MSSPPGLPSAVVISILRQSTPLSYTSVGCAALVLYDYAITLLDEIEIIWAPLKINSTSAIFVLNRITMLLFILGQIVSASDWTTIQGCIMSDILGTIPQVFQYVVWAGFSTTRVYALTGGQQKLLSLLVFMLSAFPFALGLFYLGQTSPKGTWVAAISSSEALCDIPATLTPEMDYVVVYGSSASVIVADAIVLAVTWKTTYSMWREGQKAGVKTPLAHGLLRDGTWYFIVILVANVVPAVLSLTVSAVAMQLGDWVLAFMTIIISRFILNLRKVSRTYGSSGTDELPSSDLLFASRIVSDMGTQVNGTFGFGELPASTADEAMEQ